MRALGVLGFACLMQGLMPGLALAAPSTLLLEVWVGDHTDGATVPIIQDGDHLLMARTDFAALKLSITPPSGDQVDLGHLPGLSAHINQADQRLELHVATAALPRQDFDLHNSGPAFAGTQTETGAILHYGLSATGNNLVNTGRSVTGGGDLSLDIFTPLALIHTEGFATGGAGWQGARLDSSATFDNAESLTHLTLGDAINVTPDWSRAVRFGGVEYASDFSLRPGLVTQPLPSFFGQSAVPATVDVFSGAVKVYQQPIDAGPFSLRNLPIVTGGGTATVVTTDILGRQTAQTISLFTTMDMLAPGLDDYAIDAGFVRTRYGQDSLGYDAPMVSANWRRGVSDSLTVEGHGEFAQHLAQMGGGGEIGFGFGLVSADVAASQSDAGFGNMMAASLQLNGGLVNLFGHAMLATPSFRDLASLDQNSAPPRLRYQMGANMDLHSWGLLAISWLDNKNAGDVARQYFTTSWSADLPNDMFLSLTGLEDLHAHIFSAELALTIPLGGNAVAGVSGALRGSTPSAQAIYTDPASPDGGLGYRMVAGTDTGGQFLGNVSYIGRSAEVDGGLDYQDGALGLQGNADGAIVLLRGSLFASHDPGNAVALVDTGEKNIRVYLENREIARSDDSGHVLLTGLIPYAPNHISVESRDYSFETVVEKTDMVVAPRHHGGVVADFAPPRHHTMIVRVVQGGDIPLGAQVTLDGDAAPIIVGRNGRFQIADLTAPRGATVRFGDKICRITINPGDTGANAHVCLREVAGAY